jgi:hypothetical protein
MGSKNLPLTLSMTDSSRVKGFQESQAYGGPSKSPDKLYLSGIIGMGAEGGVTYAHCPIAL